MRLARAVVVRSLVCGLAWSVFACSASPPIEAAREPIVVPGDWAPPSTTLALSNPQYVEVVDPPAVAPMGRCDSSCPDDIWGGLCTHPACTRAHPGTAELDAYIRGRWGYVRAGGTYTCRRNSNPDSCNNLSVHSIGRAIDLMITEIGGDADNTAGDAVANWLIENAEYIGIQRVIWDGKYWNGSRRGAHFSDISDRLCGGRYCVDHHTNHIHVELSVDGGARRTRFFTEGAPPTTCPIVCYGTAAVREDCSYTDCAATGEVCLTDPVRCGAGAPPEPTAAVRHAEIGPPTVAAIGGLTRLALTAPTRLFDTRTPESSTLLMRSDGAVSGPLGGARSGTIAAIPGLPAGTSALWLNVAAVPLTTPGFVVAHPAGPVPPISTVNYAPPRVRANATAVALGAGGVTFTANTDVEVITDMAGAFATGGLGLRTAGPLRVLDTRSIDAPLVAEVPYTVDVRAPADARGVIATITVVQGGTEPGFLTVFPCGAARPPTSNVNFVASSATANTVVSELGTGQTLCLVSNVSVHAIIDVTGYLVETGELSYQPISPARWLDTRQETSLYSGRLGEGQVIELPIQSAPGMPADVRAVIVNLATISPGTRGFLTAYPCGTTPPGSSSLNFDADDPIAAVSVSAIGAGSLCVFSNTRTHLIVDLLGVWVPTPDAPPPTEGPPPPTEDPEDMDPPVAGDDDAGIVTPLDDAGVSAGVDASTTTRLDAGSGSGGLAGTCGCRAVGSSSRARSLAAFTALLALAGLLRVQRSAKRRRRA